MCFCNFYKEFVKGHILVYTSIWNEFFWKSEPISATVCRIATKFFMKQLQNISDVQRWYYLEIWITDDSTARQNFTYGYLKNGCNWNLCFLTLFWVLTHKSTSELYPTYTLQIKLSPYYLRSIEPNKSSDSFDDD